MPRYDFTCADCETLFELRLSMSDYASGEGRRCPECGSENAERAFTAVNVIAGGGGGGYSTSASPGGSMGNSCGTGGFT